ncbi:hypothetical protein [Desmospora profundinema]|uniref:DUF2007 domain-containing protein n=1 Tax=Desmospora profundinema TaxID=1571184 RepID=A0ABU1IJI7_9BACL|nr:hypothetical protein [Desmospora profundinema]MDR6224944.1 hypothetical protein [Desmospora profundinema]
MECQAGNCSIHCPGGCGCISESENPDRCNCFCSDPIFRWNGDLDTVELETVVNLYTKDFPLKELALVFERITPYHISIPAKRLDTYVTVRISNTALGEILEEIGLHIFEEKEEDPDCPDCGCGKGDYKPT